MHANFPSLFWPATPIFCLWRIMEVVVVCAIMCISQLHMHNARLQTHHHVEAPNNATEAEGGEATGGIGDDRCCALCSTLFCASQCVTHLQRAAYKTGLACLPMQPFAIEVGDKPISGCWGGSAGVTMTSRPQDSPKLRADSQQLPVVS